jgi:hypothetical protein
MCRLCELLNQFVIQPSFPQTSMNVTRIPAVMEERAQTRLMFTSVSAHLAMKGKTVKLVGGNRIHKRLYTNVFFVLPLECIRHIHGSAAPR